MASVQSDGSGVGSSTILLIEDNPADVILLKEILSEATAPFHLEVVDCMRRALERLRAGGIDLVLTDLSLSDSSRHETFRTLRDAAPGLPIMVLSGLDDEENAVKMVEEGAQDYLIKGRIDHDGLVRAMRYALERNRSRMEVARAHEALQRAHDELDGRVQERTAELTRTASQLQETLQHLQEAQQRIVQQERLSALGRMASGIAHDFNNALSPIIGLSELMLTADSVTGEKSMEYLRLIHLAAKDSVEIVRRLREFYRYRDEHDVFAPVALNDLVQQVEELTKPRWKTQALGRGAVVQFVTDLKSIPPVAGSESELREMLINLVFNAVDSIPGHGTITCRTFLRGRAVILQVGDTGSGMTEDVRLRCLEPFFTTKADHGTGLGLAMTSGIVRRHGGEIEIESSPGNGTTITISLVAHQPARETQPVEPAPKPSSALAILAVDDEQLIREVLVVCLAEDGHKVETAANGHEGLQKLSTRPFDLVITDRSMPHMNGDQFAEVVRKLYPDMPVILLTGMGDLMAAVGDHPSVFDVVALKPFTRDSLRVAIAGALARHTHGTPAPDVRGGGVIHSL